MFFFFVFRSFPSRWLYGRRNSPDPYRDHSLQSDGECEHWCLSQISSGREHWYWQRWPCTQVSLLHSVCTIFILFVKQIHVLNANLVFSSVKYIVLEGQGVKYTHYTSYRLNLSNTKLYECNFMRNCLVQDHLFKPLPENYSCIVSTFTNINLHIYPDAEQLSADHSNMCSVPESNPCHVAQHTIAQPLRQICNIIF